jgi:hypothetical protein
MHRDCRVSNDSLWDLPPSLVYLDLTRCYFITDDGLQVSQLALSLVAAMELIVA